MRYRLYQVVCGEDGITAGTVYNLIMMGVIIISLIPLTVHEPGTLLVVVDRLSVCVFILDYLLRFVTADFQLEKGPVSFLRYPVTPMAIIDLLAILASLSVFPSGLRILKIFRLLRTLRVVRSFKLFRYSKSIEIIIGVLRNQRKPLMAVCTLAIGYVLIAALVIFNIEPETFPSFFEAVYWAAVSLTTIGYGDIYPVSTIGRIVTMVSSFVGIAIVALPSGIITAGYMSEIEKEK